MQLKDQQPVPLNFFLFVKEIGIFHTRASLQAPWPYIYRRKLFRCNLESTCSSDNSENSQEHAIIETSEKKKCPGPENDDCQMCALPEDGLQMDRNDIIGDLCLEKVCEEEFSNIADDCYESPDSVPGSIYSNECSSEEIMLDDTGDDSEPHDSPKNERESSIYPGSAFTNGNFDALLLAFFKKHHTSESAKGDLLKLLELTLPDGNNTATSSYRDCLLRHSLIELCPKCYEKVKKELCENEDCEDKGVKIDPLRFFVLSLKPQV